MKSLILSILVTQALGHAIWQDLWVNGVDKGSTCVRLPGTSYVSNSPVTVGSLLLRPHSVVVLTAS
jgi:lytic cellulose monooxygenase (C1-hydroxylating)